MTHSSYARNRPLRIRQSVVALLAGGTVYLLATLLRGAPRLVETLYGSVVGPILVRILATITGLVPFSIAEWVVIGYVVWLLALGGLTIRSLATRQRQVRNALAAGALRAGRDAGVILVLFYATWGLNYARPSLEAQLGWPAWTESSAEELVPLAIELVRETNAHYRELHGSDDAGVATALPMDLAALTADIELGWTRLTEQWPLPITMAWHYGPVKPLLSTPLVGRFGTAGFYFPLTGEANLLRGMPAVTLPRRAGHELAHQRGIGSEAEANFLGYAAAALSPNPYARYSALAFAQMELVNAVRQFDPETARRLAAERVPGFRRDLDSLNAYFAQFRGPTTSVGRAVNDRFLRANRVPGGIQNYDRVLQLLIQFSRQNGGSAIPRSNLREAASDLGGHLLLPTRDPT